MKFYLPKMPKFVTWFYPKRIWAFSRSEPKVYLTFDDGPIPEVTPWVLNELKNYNAKATFFCIGENISKHPDILELVSNDGHEIGNHTYHHLNGTKTTTTAYINDTKKAEDLMENPQSLFRPPYGKMTHEQAKAIKALGYHIVMWDVISYDWDKTISEKQCLNNVLKHIRPGSIVVFHDSLKAERNIRYVLPKVLEHIKKQAWKAEKIRIKA